MLLKSLVVFVRPDLGLASMARVTPERPGKIVVAGVMLIAVGGFLGYSVWQG